MNRTMTKNICLVAAFFITAILAVLMMGNNAGATASAASAEFEFVVREVGDTDLSIEERNNLPDNTYALDINLEVVGEVEGPVISFRLNYDSANFDVITQETDDGIKCLTDLGMTMMYENAIDTNIGQLAVVGASAFGTLSSGRFITLYVEKKTTNSDFNPIASFEVVEFHDGDLTPVTVTVPNHVLLENKYILGDLNGDGIADADDASLLLAGLEDSNTIGIEKLYWVLYDENFPATVICFEQVDANQDGYIMEDDADEILSAYASGMFGNYTGDIGTVMVYYVTLNM